MACEQGAADLIKMAAGDLRGAGGAMTEPGGPEELLTWYGLERQDLLVEREGLVTRIAEIDERLGQIREGLTPIRVPSSSGRSTVVRDVASALLAVGTGVVSDLARLTGRNPGSVSTALQVLAKQDWVAHRRESAEEKADRLPFASHPGRPARCWFVADRARLKAFVGQGAPPPRAAPATAEKRRAPTAAHPTAPAVRRR
jgi:hypothetical protein